MLKKKSWWVALAVLVVLLAAGAAVLLTRRAPSPQAAVFTSTVLPLEEDCYDVASRTLTRSDPEGVTGSCRGFTGGWTLWRGHQEAPGEMTITCTVTVLRGAIRLVLVDEGGDVTVLLERTDSAEGQGSTFTCTAALPAGDCAIKLLGREETDVDFDLRFDIAE